MLDRRPRCLCDQPDDPDHEGDREQARDRRQPIEELVAEPVPDAPGPAEPGRAVWDRSGFHRAGAFQPHTGAVTSVTTPSHIIHILSTLAVGAGRETHTVSTMDQAKPNEGARPAIGVAPPPSAADVSREVVFDIDDLSVHYGKALAVGGVTLDIHRNAITALIGPSGCGKSTVLRCLNRMNDLVPSARVDGKVLYHGTDLYGNGVDPIEVRRRIGMVFQRPNPFPKSIYDNVAYGLRILGMKDNLDDRVEQALRSAALWDEVKDAAQALGTTASPVASSNGSASRGRSPSSRT